MFFSNFKEKIKQKTNDTNSVGVNSESIKSLRRDKNGHIIYKGKRLDSVKELLMAHRMEVAEMVQVIRAAREHLKEGG